MGVRFTVTTGPNKGRVFTFNGHDTFLVGRSNRAHFQLPVKDRYFSRSHFLVEINPPRCRLMDLASRNGTYVNGERVQESDLHDGDKIKAGRTTFLVSIDKVVSRPLPQNLPPRQGHDQMREVPRTDRSANPLLAISVAAPHEELRSQPTVDWDSPLLSLAATPAVCKVCGTAA
jgi:serine/threonine-protein kinase